MSNVLRVTPEQYEWLKKYPFIWFAPGARSEFHRVTPGEPGVEYEADGETVASYVWAHPDIDGFDVYILAVIIKGKEYTDDISDEETRLGTIMARAVADRDAFLAIVARIKAGELTHAAATVLIRAEAIKQGTALGVPPYVEPVADDDAELLEDVDPDGYPD